MTPQNDAMRLARPMHCFEHEGAAHAGRIAPVNPDALRGPALRSSPAEAGSAGTFLPRPTPIAPRIPLIGAFALFALAFLAAGCGRREAAADRAIREGVLLQSIGDVDPRLDPHLSELLAEGAIVQTLFEGLIRPDPLTLEPRPAAAESWQVSDDGLVYTFQLRANARWSNGEPVTASDFVASFRRALAPELGATNAPLLYVLRGARAFHTHQTGDPEAIGAHAVDTLTLQLTVEAPCPHFLSLLTHFVWLPVHLPAIRAAGPETSRTTNWTTPERHVGNGPFRLAEVRPRQYVRVEANPQYHDAGALPLRAVMFYSFGVDAEERAYRGGQIHITDALPIGKLPAWRVQQPEAVRVAPSFGLYFYRLNVTRPPLDNPLVRRALSAAVDRRALTDRLLNGAYVPAHSFTPPGPAGYQPPALAPDDVALARQLLAEAGFAGGTGLRHIEILYNTSDNHRVIAEAIQEMWRRNLGIEAVLANQDYGVFVDNRKGLRFDVARSPWFGDYLDPLSFLEIFTTGNPNNQTGWSSTEYDRLIAEAARTPDPARRLGLFARAETILLEEAPIIPIYVYSTVRLVDPRVQGWFDNPLDQHPHEAMSFSAGSAQ